MPEGDKINNNQRHLGVRGQGGSTRRAAIHYTVKLPVGVAPGHDASSVTDSAGNKKNETYEKLLGDAYQQATGQPLPAYYEKMGYQLSFDSKDHYNEFQANLRTHMLKENLNALEFREKQAQSLAYTAQAEPRHYQITTPVTTQREEIDDKALKVQLDQANTMYEKVMAEEGLEPHIKPKVRVEGGVRVIVVTFVMPEEVEAMERFVQDCKEQGIPLIIPPGPPSHDEIVNQARKENAARLSQGRGKLVLPPQDEVTAMRQSVSHAKSEPKEAPKPPEGAKGPGQGK